jgi:hypothetical protein
VTIFYHLERHWAAFFPGKLSLIFFQFFSPYCSTSDLSYWSSFLYHLLEFLAVIY